MKLRQLQCFCAVVDADFNISRASEALHTTQPSVGKHLKQLEEELASDLLVRSGGRILGLTPNGEQILVWARRALQCTENIRSASRDARQAHGTLTLATSHTHANYVILPAILEFTRRFPEVQIGVQQGAPEHVAEMVRSGKADIGVIHEPPDLPREVVALPFLSAPQCLIMPLEHPLKAEPDLTLEKLASFPLIVQSKDRPQGQRVLGEFDRANLSVRVSVQALDADVMKTYVAAGLGIAVVPSYSFRDLDQQSLVARDVSHLFEPGVSAALLRRDSHIRNCVFEFLEELSDELPRSRVDAVVSGVTR
jgi:DNA-binding transcriptional LysR family regulator